MLGLILPFNIALGITLIFLSCINYLLLYRFISRKDGEHVRKITKYITSIVIQNISNFIVSNIAIIIISMMFERMDMEYIYVISQVCGAGSSFVLGYFLAVYFTFAEKREKKDTNMQPPEN